MNKQSLITILLTALMSMTGAKTFAYDFAIANSDGVTIYYKWANSEKTEVAVSYDYSSTWRGSFRNYYSGNIVIPGSVVYEGNTYSVTSIDNRAFQSCSGLTSVTFPNNLTSFGSEAFEGCSSLTSVTIPNSVISIGSSAFSGCIGLTSVTIPNSVISIGSGAFTNCSGLTSVTIPNSVTSIGSGAFSYCSGLTSVRIPNGVTTIGSDAFRSCNSLTSVIIGSGVTSIGDNAFSTNYLKKTIWLTNTPPSGYKNASGTINYVSNDQFSFNNNQVKYQFLSSYFEVDGIRYVPVSPSEKTCDAIDCIYDESAVNTKISSTVSYKGVSMNVKKIDLYG